MTALFAKSRHFILALTLSSCILTMALAQTSGTTTAAPWSNTTAAPWSNTTTTAAPTTTATPVTTALPATRANFTLRLSGNWTLAVAKNSSSLMALMQGFIAGALGVNQSNVMIRRIYEGSLVTEFTLMNTSQTVNSVTSALNSAPVPGGVVDFYRATTGLSGTPTNQGVTAATPAPAPAPSASAALTAVAATLVALLVQVAMSSL